MSNTNTPTHESPPRKRLWRKDVLAALAEGRTDFSNCNLSGADLSGANLSGAILSGANLTGANLTDSYLSGANLSGAILSGANLTGVTLSLDQIGQCILSPGVVEVLLQRPQQAAPPPEVAQTSEVLQAPSRNDKPLTFHQIICRLAGITALYDYDHHALAACLDSLSRALTAEAGHLDDARMHLNDVKR